MEEGGRRQGRMLTPCDAWTTLPNKERPLISAMPPPPCSPDKEPDPAEEHHLSSPVLRGHFQRKRVTACYSFPGLLDPSELKSICSQIALSY